MRFPHFSFNRRRADPTPSPRGRRTGDHPAGDGCLFPLPPQYTGLADEVEAWVNGELADLRSSSGRKVPSWLVLNRPAHADLAVLSLLAQGLAPPGSTPFRWDPTWVAAEQGVARHLFHDGARPDEVLLVQRDVLVPLELRLIERARTEPLSLGEVVAATMKALGEHRLEQ